MLPGSNISPYRLPCSGTTLCSNGPRYQHAKPSENGIPVWLYDSQVPNWTGDGYVDPYERFNPENACGLDPNPCSGSDDCTAGDNPPCLPWLGDTGDCQFIDLLNTPGATVVDGAITYTGVWYQPQMLTAATVDDAGSGYEVGDLLTIAGGTLSTYVGPGSGAATVVVSGVNGSGGITTVKVQNTSSYKTNPSSPNPATAGHGTGATLNLTFGNQTMNF